MKEPCRCKFVCVMKRVKSFTRTSSLSPSSHNPCNISAVSSILPLFFFFHFQHLLTVVLNSTVLHKSPLYLAACCGRFYNPLLRQWWGLFHHLRRLQCCRETERPTNIWESSRWLWGKLLSLSVVFHASLAVSFHFMSFPFSQQSCVSLFAFFVLPPSGWASFVISLAFLFLIFHWLTGQPVYKVQCSAAAQSGSSLLPVFMWQRPDLLKAGALTKKRTNDRERCQSNSQAFQRCKQMYACTKGRCRNLFRAST